MSDLLMKYMGSLIATNSMADYIKFAGVKDMLEHVPLEKEMFTEFSDYITKYNKIPSSEAFEDIFDEKVPRAKEPPEYYYEKLKARHIKKSMIKASSKASDFLKDGEVEKAFLALAEMVQQVELQELKPQIFDFRESHDLLANEMLMKQLPEYGVNLGWDSFDIMSGGLRGADLIALLARPGLGKTILMLAAALHAWRTQKKKVLFVSMEMAVIRIFERMSAMDQHIPYNWVKYGHFSTFKVDRKKKYLENLAALATSGLQEFNVIDGNLSTSVQEVARLTGQLKPDIVFIDGAYMLDFEGGFQKDKVGAVANELKKSVATKNNIPVMATYQFNRKSTDLKKNETAGLEHIGYSDVIGQVSTIVLGIFQRESVETVKQREINIVKGRDGEEGSFCLNWDFINMDFSEIEKIQDHKVMVTRK